MKKLTILLLLALGVTYSYAYTNIIVGKRASKDGSVLVSYNADSYGAFMGLQHIPAATHPKGSVVDYIEFDIKLKGNYEDWYYSDTDDGYYIEKGIDHFHVYGVRYSGLTEND